MLPTYRSFSTDITPETNMHIIIAASIWDGMDFGQTLLALVFLTGCVIYGFCTKD